MADKRNIYFKGSDTVLSNFYSYTIEIVNGTRRFQPPLDLEGVISETKRLIQEESKTNQFLPETPKDFFIYNVDGMLKQIDRSLYDKQQPRLRALETDRIAEMLAEKVVDKLFDLQDAASLKENNIETTKENIVQKKKDTRKWSFRDLLTHCFHVSRKNRDDN